MTTSISGPFVAGNFELTSSAEPPNDQIVAVGAVDSEHVNQRFVFGRINNLANAEKRFAAGNVQQFGNNRVGGSGVNFFVGIAQLHLIVALDGGKERIMFQLSCEQTGEFGSRKVASF